MELIQAIAALITVSSAAFYFVTVLVKSYKMFKTNEAEITKEAKEKVQEVVKQAQVIKANVEEKVEAGLQGVTHTTPNPEPKNNESNPGSQP